MGKSCGAAQPGADRTGKVRALAELGELKTEFGQIGPLVQTALHGARKFRIAEVVPLLRGNPGADDVPMRKIEWFVEKDSRGEVSYNVTIVLQESEFIVKYGNKRTIAFYERRRESINHPIEFPVFVVESA